MAGLSVEYIYAWSEGLYAGEGEMKGGGRLTFLNIDLWSWGAVC